LHSEEGKEGRKEGRKRFIVCVFEVGTIVGLLLID